jgi:hypothetical protein
MAARRNNAATCWQAIGDLDRRGRQNAPQTLTTTTAGKAKKSPARCAESRFYGNALVSHWTHQRSAEEGRLPTLGIPRLRRGGEEGDKSSANATDHPLVWIDTADVLADLTQRAIHRVPPGPCHEVNPYEADVIEALLRAIDADALARLTDPVVARKMIGLIAFYSKQVELLQGRIARMGRPDLERNVEVGTVDSFQGKEFPLVILSAVRSNAEATLGFLALPQRINVAMSRAQRQLIIVGDTATLAVRARGRREPPPLRRVFESLRHDSEHDRRGIVVPSRLVLP